MQIAGASCLIASVRLAENGLYVNVPKGDFLLPATIAEFADFNTTVMPVLMLLRKEVLSIADKLLLVLKEKTNVKGPLGRVNASSTNYMAYYQRNTWYTPPHCAQSQIPSSLFGFPPPSILQKLMSLSYEALETNESSSSASTGGSSSGYDEFGFKKVENGYYGKITTGFV